MRTATGWNHGVFGHGAVPGRAASAWIGTRPGNRRHWLAALATGIVLVFGAAGASAAGPQPAGGLPAEVDRCPFTGKYPVEILLESPMHLRWLEDWKIDIDNVRGLVATAYVDDAEFAELAAAGIQLHAIPNEARRAWQAWQEHPEREDYHNYDALTTELQNIAAAYPAITKLISIGASVQGRELWAIKISDNAAIDEPEPEFKFSATIHGNEPVGTELCIYMIRLLTQQYGVDPQITALVNDLELWFVPMHNPDGNALGTRYNAQGYDLNRSFPDPRTDPIDDPAGRPTEVQHMMRFVYGHNFILGANYHTGALVVNYPWDTWYGQYTPDDTMIRNLALGYSSRNLPMYNNPEFPQGVVIGWEWYVISGGMQDWSYHWRNEVHYTIELSNTSWPPSSQLPTLWNDNRESMLWLMNQARIGVEGYVTDAQGGTPIKATVAVQEIGKDVWGEPEHGYYHRLLEPGTYTLQFSAFGYTPQTLPGVAVVAGATARRDVALQRTTWFAVSGTVTEAGTGAPLAGEVAAYRHDTGELFRTVTTNPATGAYALDVPAWEYDFVASAEGHAPATATRTIAGPTAIDFELIRSRGDVLVVLDNNASTNIGNDLSSLGFVVTTEDYTATNPTMWENHDLLIWSAGSYRNPVASSTLRDALEAYVAAGGKLLIEGGEVGFDALRSPGYPSFAANVLHVDNFHTDQAGDLPLAAGMGGHDLVTTPNALPATIQITYDYFADEDAVTPRPEAYIVYGTTSFPGDAGILVYDVPGRAEGQIVYYAFDYAALTSPSVAENLLDNTATYLLRPSQGVVEAPVALRLELGRPLPAVTSSGTTLHLTLTASARACVAVYDAAGRRVRVLADGELGAGAHAIAWDGRDRRGDRVAAGVYFIRAAAGGARSDRRLVVVD
jgi:hypothetical protein